MHTKAPKDPPNPNFRWEVRDLNVRTLALSVTVLYVLVVVCAALSVWIMSLMGGHVLSDGPSHQENRRIPKEPYPVLQDNFTASVDMHNLRRKENAVLNSEGVTPDGKRHIPIDQAIDMEAQSKGR